MIENNTENKIKKNKNIKPSIIVVGTLLHCGIKIVIQDTMAFNWEDESISGIAASQNPCF